MNQKKNPKKIDVFKKTSFCGKSAMQCQQEISVNESSIKK